MKRAGGFTLVEMMVVVSIVIVLTGVGVPAMQDFIANQRVKSAASELFSDILQARSEAIKRNTDVTLAPAGSWNQGWSVASPVAGEPDLVAHGPLGSVSITGPLTLTYTPEGRVRGGSSPAFSFSSASGKPRCLTVDLGGRPNVQPKAC